MALLNTLLSVCDLSHKHYQPSWWDFYLLDFTPITPETLYS